MKNQPDNENVIQQKTLELCQLITAQPEFEGIRKSVQAFMADMNAQNLYQSLSEKGMKLHQKQHDGFELDPTEVAIFDKEREVFFGNPIAKSFVEAQERMQEIQETVNQHIMKTFELGRVPTARDFEHECCGGHDGHCNHEHGGEGCTCHQH